MADTKLAFQVLAEDVCASLSDKYGKDCCLYTGQKVPSSDQVRLVVLDAKGRPKAVKQSCFCSAEALHHFLKELGKGTGAADGDVKHLLLVNGVSKVDKARANTVRQIAAARGKCSVFMSAEELKALEAARQKFVEDEKQKAAESAEKAKEKDKKDASTAVAEGEKSPEKKKRAPKRKLIDIIMEGSQELVPPTPVVRDSQVVDDWCGCSGPVEPVAGVKEPSPKAKRVKKSKPAEILGQAPQESLSAQPVVEWASMAQ